MVWYKFLILCALTVQTLQGLIFEKYDLDEILNILIPTVKSTNQKCQNHSIFYMNELKKLKLWATEMFDASSKFPSGVIFGSTYDFGNFDECLEIKVPVEDEKIVGKHCMAKFHITPPDVEDCWNFNENYFNASTWQKIVTFSKQRRRSTRNDFYFSYCIPSSCQYNDLESSLKKVTDQVNSISNFQVTATVNPLNCQLKTGFNFSTGDLTFISVVLLFVTVTFFATLYDWFTKIEDFNQYKLEEKKHLLLTSFSMWTNSVKLCNESANDEGLQCIHGLKVISMFLIIMGHRIMFGIGSPIVNPNFVEDMYGKIETTVLLNGPIIVNTFFNISGFLACYLILKECDKRKKGENFLFLYIHRLLRLTPVYAVVIAFYCTLFVKLGSGPFWLERIQIEQERCVKSWWANLFYLNNYVNKEHICMFQSWYLTCDMHFFLLAPVITCLLRKYPSLGITALCTIIITSISVVFATVYFNNEEAILLLYMKFLKDPVVNNTFKNIYMPTHMRASPYFVGMLTGYLKYQMRKKQYKLPKYAVYLGWTICFIVIEATVYLAFVFYIPEKPYDPLISATYAAMHSFTWSICISWMIVAISEGYGAWIEPILKWKPLILLSRITYTAFLCHGAIQIYAAATLRSPSYISIFNLVYYTAGDITLSYIAGWVLSMLFEAPILGLEKIILTKDSTGNTKEKKSTISSEFTPKIKIINRF